jgi:hypothetical protein
MTRIEPASRLRAGRLLADGLLDAALVLIFAAVGRSSHGEAVVGGLLTTAWPFLLGLLVGWLVAFAVGGPSARGRFDGWRIRPAGLIVWGGTLGVGMLARVLAGQGTAPSFILVAGLVLGLFLLGWRALAAVIVRRRTRPSSG